MKSAVKTRASPQKKKALKAFTAGCAKQEQGDLIEAVKCYREAIELDSSNVNAHYNLAR